MLGDNMMTSGSDCAAAANWSQSTIGHFVFTVTGDSNHFEQLADISYISSSVKDVL